MSSQPSPSLRPQIGRGHWAYGESQVVLILLLCGKVCYLNFLKYAFLTHFIHGRIHHFFLVIFIPPKSYGKKKNIFFFNHRI